MNKPLLSKGFLFFIACFFSTHFLSAQNAANTNCPGTTLTPGQTLTPSDNGGTTTTVRNGGNSGVAVTPCGGNADDDVWYNFVAAHTYATVTLTNIGSALNTSGARLQMFSGNCAGLTSIACGTTTINATGLTVGATYYIRVYSAGATALAAGATSSFNISLTPSAKTVVGSGRMNEVFHQQIISAPQVLFDPWEVTYGPDDNLWVTESKGYKVYRINPVTGVRDTVLDISNGSTFFSAPDNAFNIQFNFTSFNPQGGLAGLAIHPQFLAATSPKNFVYVSYIRSGPTGSSPSGIFYVNRVVRFTYNPTTRRLESPVSVCDTLPGSSDHNSQRMIVAPVGGTDYLFYAAGDMGAGQFGNTTRPIRSQDSSFYEGKILRFNLEPDGDAGLLDRWIPNNNPYNTQLGKQSAVWAIGIRNNQGFAYDPFNNILYGASHGAYSDDEINIIEPYKNYGHPLVIGYAADDNYNGATAGAGMFMSPAHSASAACPIIVDESNNAAAIFNYKDPLFSAYQVNPTAGISSIYNDIWNKNPTPNTPSWPSEAWSGMDVYTNKIIPGWKQSVVAASLKWGRLVKIKLNAAGTSVIPTGGQDTVSYFGGLNRFRDMSFAPNGKDIYVIMDRSTNTSGPSSTNPIVPACPGCVQKYTFLGYNNVSGRSAIPASIDVTTGTVNTCNDGTTVVIDATNNNLWVPITGPDGNIMAEIKANGNNLGTVTSSFYKNSGAIRVRNSFRYLDRNITITPQNQPSSNVDMSLYISKAEYDALDADGASGISAITDLRILKNNDACGAAVASNTTAFTPNNTDIGAPGLTLADFAHGTNGYVLHATIPSFSSFYFGSANITLPLELLSFDGELQNSGAALLKWQTEDEINTANFVVERSLNGVDFSAIGTVEAKGNNNTTDVFNYSLIDAEASRQPVSVLYYRLKITDNDGSSKYSNIVTLSLKAVNARIVVTPNPVVAQARLDIKAVKAGTVQWTLTDNAGRVVLQNNVQAQQGNNTVYINTDKIAAGIYFVKVKGAGIDEQVKIVKVK
jgi:trimeric autotransporter adhesin